MDHAEMYARLGGVVTRSLYERLSSIGAFPAPGDQSFHLEMINEPWMSSGAWSFTFDVALPNDEGTIMFMVGQIGSGFDFEKITLPMPPEHLEDTDRKDFPPEHKDAYFKLLHQVEDEIRQRGFVHDPNRDVHINQDYYPSTGVSVTVMNPGVLTSGLATACQSMLQNQPFAFWISFILDIADPAYKGTNEALIVRPDRIVEDWNADRLRREFPDRFTW